MHLRRRALSERGTKAGAMLDVHATLFRTVEIEATYYRVPPGDAGSLIR
jgi:uncharacterized protein YecE (DUF72 family)